MKAPIFEQIELQSLNALSDIVLFTKADEKAIYPITQEGMELIYLFSIMSEKSS